MTCSSCEAKVKTLLSSVPGITDVNVSKESQKAEVYMVQHISTDVLKSSLEGTKYSLEEEKAQHQVYEPIEAEEKITLKTYLPIFLIFGYITGITLLIQFVQQSFDYSEWMRHFMAGFFLVFSFFKLLDVPAFAMSYSSYDIVAKRFPLYGYIYPFIELSLGLAFLIPAFHYWSNLITFMVMTVSIIGVIQSMLRKSKFQCACLGAVFKLPLSKITLFEDALMIVMSLISLTI